jgi:hypothetical protein
VHWRDKWLLVPYQGQLSLLQGLDSSDVDTLMLQLYVVPDSDATTIESEPFLSDIQALIDRFPQLF